MASPSIATPIAGRTSAADGLAAAALAGALAGAVNGNDASALWWMRETLQYKPIPIAATPTANQAGVPFKNYGVVTIPFAWRTQYPFQRHSPSLATPIAGRVGVADGLTQAALTGLVGGALSGIEAASLWWMRETLQRPQPVVDITPTSTGSPKGTAFVADVPLVVQWASAGSPKVTADATIPLTVGATATVIQRAVAAVTVPLRMVTSSSVMLTIRGAITLAIKWLIGSRGRVGYRRVRGRDLSGVAILEQNQSGHAMPVRDRSGVGVTVKDDSEGRPW